jgi:hypothetical protein
MNMKNRISIKRRARLFLAFFLPNQAMKYLGFIYGALLPSKKSYSSMGEDLIIEQYFKEKNILQGVYIDIGCFHPIWASNTHKLHKDGWTGFCFDIDQSKLNMMRLFRRKSVQTFFQAVTAKPSKEPFTHVYKFLTPWSDIDTCDLDVANDYAKKFDLDYEISRVPSADINTILSKLPKFNFLNIDVEGLDEDILMSMDLNKYSPDVILFENVDVWGGTEKIRNKLELFCYERLFISSFSVCYAKSILRKI